MESLTDAQRALFAAGGSLDDYDVLKPIGKGKFSVVYKAVRKRDAQPVALKKIAIFDMMDAKAREKTLKEVRLVQSVRHPNIIEYLDAFIANNELHIAFAWAEAGDLKRQIRKANEKGVRFDERTIWRYFTQLCAAIRHMHEARIMHRDIKPANILLTLQGIVKVGDLGLGRHLSENTMEARSKVGTPLYMSPEVLRGDGYDWKSDVWSLGCILYELAMLRSPFKAEGLDLFGLFQKINKCDYEPVSPVYSGHLRSAVTRMITLAPAERPSMEEVWSMCQARPSTAVLAKKRERIQAQAVAAAAASVAAEKQSMQSGETDTNDSNHGNNATTTAPGGNVQIVRRKKKQTTTTRASARTQPLPSTTTTSSRTQQEQQQQNQDDQSNNSSLRPPSSSSTSRPPSSSLSQRSSSASRTRPASASTSASPEDPTTTDDVKRKQQHTEARMELVYERLKLLHFERALPHCYRRVTRTYFLVDAATPTTQVRASSSTLEQQQQQRFADLCAVVCFLLKLLDVDATTELDAVDGSSNRSSIAAAQILLLGAERAGVGATVAHISGPALTRGGGDDVCVLLDALSAKALENCSRSGGTLQRPIYIHEPLDDIVADDNDEVLEAQAADTDDGCWGDSTASMPTDDRTDAIERQQQRAMIHARVDPVAWSHELARLAPVLRERVAAAIATTSDPSAWFAHVAMLRRNVAVIHDEAPGACRRLAQAQQTRDDEAQRLAARETQLHETLQREQRQFRISTLQLATHVATAQTTQTRVQTASVQLANVQAALATTTRDVKRANQRVTDRSPLVSLQQQLQQLQRENQQFATQLHAMQHALMHQQQRGAMAATVRR